jgi:Tol biopolymer transport system component
MKNLRLIIIFLFIFLTSCSKDSGASSSTSSVIPPGKGGEMILENGARLSLEPGSFEEETVVTFKIVSSDITLSESDLVSLGEVYEVDLDPTELTKPAKLELPINIDNLPPEISENELFIAYFDESVGEWVYQGGIADFESGIISLQITHGSKWGVARWDWDKWPAFVNKILSLSVDEWYEAYELIKHECKSGGINVTVDGSLSNNMILGCVDEDNEEYPKLSLVNPQLITYDISVFSGGNDYPAPQRMFRGDIVEFDASVYDPSPLIISAIWSEETLYLDLFRATIALLPGGLDVLGKNGSPLFICLAEAYDNYSFLPEGYYEAKIEEDASAVFEIIMTKIFEEGFLSPFFNNVFECGGEVAKTWSVQNILKQLSIHTGLLYSIHTSLAVDYQLLLGHPVSKIGFYWDYSPPESDQLWIAYSNAKNIFLIHPDGSDDHKITYDGDNDYLYKDLTWSPDGKYIGATRIDPNVKGPVIEDQAPQITAANQLIIIDVENETQRVILKDFDGRNWSWAPDSQWIAFSQPYTYNQKDYLSPVIFLETQGIAAVNVNSLVIKEIVPNIGEYPLVRPQFIPNGTHILFHELFSVNETRFYLGELADSSYLVQIDGSYGCSWEPGSSRMACSQVDSTGARYPEGCPKSLNLLSTEGILLETLPLYPNTCDLKPYWSPDGNSILIEVRKHINNVVLAGYDLLFLNSNERVEFSKDSIIWFRSWSPDGKIILFELYENGKIFRYYDIQTGLFSPAFEGLEDVILELAWQPVH